MPAFNKKHSKVPSVFEYNIRNRKEEGMVFLRMAVASKCLIYYTLLNRPQLTAPSILYNPIKCIMHAITLHTYIETIYINI